MSSTGCAGGEHGHTSLQPPPNLPPTLQVLYSKFGFMYTDLKLNEEEYILIREEDVIGIMPRASECLAWAGAACEGCLWHTHDVQELSHRGCCPLG